ncbi:MAG: hypothetical protein H0U92_09005 [Actinobacteria bacterium]|nr:hypothetical protein [Actinomycetota bacterium]
MAAVLGNVEGHYYEMGHPDVDVFEAARAQVGLAGLKGVNQRNLEVVVVRGA